MMALALLLKDELHHLLRTRAVVITLVLLPPLLVCFACFGPGEGEMSPLFFAAAMGSNLAGVVCGAMVSTSLIGELQQGTPVLFAVRPLPRYYLLLARFFALVIALTITMAVTIGISGIISVWLWPKAQGISETVRSGLIITLTNAMLSGSIGVLVGVSVSTPLAGVLLIIFVGSNLCNLLMLPIQKLPGWTGWSAPVAECVVLAAIIILSWVLLAISARIFARKPL